ncbi:MAG TPA: nucleoside-diphosphate kinase [Thermoanaerobaculia bacterium]|nr:nucleoside-diphosphate kinase [Thermoanaerobaculia bacterium]HUM28994.1 nucleoside-diphosphate kinase [Thermoanaerobaculia bacterium]HXK67450.1 nucleoside-diphosphate kinase [Thermoanaerobaculia bacterium]
MEQTLTIIKPDSMAKGAQGKIITRLLSENFAIKGMKHIHLTTEQAKGFYAEHSGKPFFPSLITFMTEGSVIVMALERKDAVAYLREIMGVTDSLKAAPGTIRKEFGTNIERNAIHGSANLEDAKREVAYFFSGYELI